MFFDFWFLSTLFWLFVCFCCHLPQWKEWKNTPKSLLWYIHPTSEPSTPMTHSLTHLPKAPDTIIRGTRIWEFCFVFETVFHVAQVGLKFYMQSRLALKSQSPCLSSSSAKISVASESRWSHLEEGRCKDTLLLVFSAFRAAVKPWGLQLCPIWCAWIVAKQIKQSQEPKATVALHPPAPLFPENWWIIHSPPLFPY